MNVLEWGQIPPDPEEAWAILKCDHCTTKFEIQWRERMATCGRPYEDEGYHCLCPLCKKLIPITAMMFRNRETPSKPATLEPVALVKDPLPFFREW